MHNRTKFSSRYCKPDLYVYKLSILNTSTEVHNSMLKCTVLIYVLGVGLLINIKYFIMQWLETSDVFYFNLFICVVAFTQYYDTKYNL